MRHIEGEHRSQSTLLPNRIEDFIPTDHPVRVIDAFVDRLDFAALGFSKAQTKATGRKPYHPGDLLKLFLYGYTNKVTSSRRLETECHRNLEVMWLMRRLAPDFKTVADFRKDNGDALRATCRAFITFCREQGLLSGDLVAIDGSKFKSASSKDQTLTRAQIKRDRPRIEAKIDDYLNRLASADKDNADPAFDRDQVEHALERLRDKQTRFDEAQVAMDEAERNEHTHTEPEARLMRSGREGMVLGYNVQTSVEAENQLIVHHDLTNLPGDNSQLLPMAEESKSVLEATTLSVLADAGYSNGEQQAGCEAADIEATVPRRSTTSSFKDKYQKSDFVYDRDTDSFTCPAGKTLVSAGISKNHHTYRIKGCDKCPLQPQCTTSKSRMVTRHIYEDALDRSQARVTADPGLMHQRMGIAERPFAVLKHVMGFRRFACWGFTAAKSELNLAVLGYNLKTIIARMGVPEMLAMLAR